MLLIDLPPLNAVSGYLFPFNVTSSQQFLISVFTTHPSALVALGCDWIDILTVRRHHCVKHTWTVLASILSTGTPKRSSQILATFILLIVNADFVTRHRKSI